MLAKLGLTKTRKEELSIAVKRVRGNETLSRLDCRVERNGAAFSEATLTLYHAEKPPDTQCRATGGRAVAISSQPRNGPLIS